MSTKKCEIKKVDNMLINNKKSNKSSDKLSEESSNKSLDESLDDISNKSPDNSLDDSIDNLLDNLPKNKSEKKSRKKKNEVYKKEQDEVFNKIKNVLHIENNSFTSFTVKDKQDELKSLLNEVAKFFHSSVWLTVKCDTFVGCMAFLRHLFKYYGFAISAKEYAKVINKERLRGKRYFITAINI